MHWIIANGRRDPKRSSPYTTIDFSLSRCSGPKSQLQITRKPLAQRTRTNLRIFGTKKMFLLWNAICFVDVATTFWAENLNLIRCFNKLSALSEILHREFKSKHVLSARNFTRQCDQFGFFRGASKRFERLLEGNGSEWAEKRRNVAHCFVMVAEWKLSGGLGVRLRQRNSL